MQDNKIRDARAVKELRRDRWRVLIVWECAVRRPGILRADALARVCISVEKFLKSKRDYLEISGPLRNDAAKMQVKP